MTEAFKLLRVRKDGTLGPLFIHRKLRIPIGIWLDAEPHRTKGFAFRPGWHACSKPIAPHLSMKNRKWYRVQLSDVQDIHRPENQGGLWYLAKHMKVIEAAK